MQLPHLPTRKYLIPIIFVILLFSIIVTTVIINTQTDTDSRSSASTDGNASKGKMLKVRVDPGTVNQGESYTLFIDEPESYSGELDVKLNLCEYLESTSETCRTTEGKWMNAVQGKVVVDGNLLKDVQLGSYEAVFRPSGSDWEWSNPITVNIDPYDMSKYWMNEPGNYWLYDSTDYYKWEKKITIRTPANKSVTAKIEIEAPEKICDVTSTPWRFTKSGHAGYWGERMM
ncbi:MAG: hypothetical protein ACOCXT_00035 [Candidatus Dojkabacteria bacterium]